MGESSAGAREGAAGVALPYGRGRRTVGSCLVLAWTLDDILISRCMALCSALLFLGLKQFVGDVAELGLCELEH